MCGGGGQTLKEGGVWPRPETRRTLVRRHMFLKKKFVLEIICENVFQIATRRTLPRRLCTALCKDRDCDMGARLTEIPMSLFPMS